MADQNPATLAAVVASIVTAGGVIASKGIEYILGRRQASTSERVAVVAQESAVTVAAMNTLQQMVSQLTAGQQRHDTEIQTLRHEVDSERAKRHALEDEVVKLKRVIDQKERMIDKLQHEMSEKRTEWQESVAELHDENLFLRNSLKKLQEDYDTLKAEHEALKRAIGKENL